MVKMTVDWSSDKHTLHYMVCIITTKMFVNGPMFVDMFCADTCATKAEILKFYSFNISSPRIFIHHIFNSASIVN